MQVFEFYVIDDSPVVINRPSDSGWMWCRGAWQEDRVLIERCYEKGRPLSEEDFVRQFPYAALALLETPDNVTQET